MRVAELYRSVAYLGFENSLEEDVRFFPTANRALLQVSEIRPATRSLIIEHHPLQNILNTGFSPMLRRDETCFEARGARSYYFECTGHGMGLAYLEFYDEKDKRWEIERIIELISPERKYAVYRGFISHTGDVRLRFVGEHVYYLKNVAMYDSTYSALENDIPAYEPFLRYDISLIASDFLSLESPPIVDDETNFRINQGYDIENGRVILLPYDMPGDYRIIYRHRPNEIIEHDYVSEDDTVIDLDEDLCALLPLLIASYVWAEDEPEKANYYMSLYQLRAAEVERKIRNASPVTIRNANGW